jgi:hypothetical protein
MRSDHICPPTVGVVAHLFWDFMRWPVRVDILCRNAFFQVFRLQHVTVTCTKIGVCSAEHTQYLLRRGSIRASQVWTWERDISRL